MNNDLPISEELDFAYLLELMPALYDIDEYKCLPELFAIIGHTKLMKLAKYAGGEVIAIPTISDLQVAIEALQWFYDVSIKKTKRVDEIPVRLHYLVERIMKVYNAREDQAATK